MESDWDKLLNDPHAQPASQSKAQSFPAAHHVTAHSAPEDSWDSPPQNTGNKAEVNCSKHEVTQRDSGVGLEGQRAGRPPSRHNERQRVLAGRQIGPRRAFGSRRLCLLQVQLQVWNREIVHALMTGI